jgi:hypothetical protein
LAVVAGEGRQYDAERREGGDGEFHLGFSD